MREKEKEKSQQNKHKPGYRLLAIIVVLICANIVAWFFYGQADLTKDKRYTITDATKTLLRELPQQVDIIVFLEGDNLPAAFQNLANSTNNMLRQFRDLSGNKVSFRQMDPLGNDTIALHLLRTYNMTGITVTVDAGKKGKEQKTIFPWALVTMVDPQGQSLGYPVFLQEANTPNLNRKTLLRSEMLLEYNLANGIHQIGKTERPSVAYITGNGQPFDFGIFDMIGKLRRYYTIDTFNIGQEAGIPARYKTIIVHNPTRPFSETEKFKLDQYIMNGGNVLWSINMVAGNLDSMRSGHFNAMPADLNLSDLLFNYGVRINANLVKDAASSAFIPLQAASENATADAKPWVYFPVLNPTGSHPIVKNLGGVLGRFVSSIDTNANDASISKTILLSSSRYSKLESTPAPVLLKSAIELPNPATYTDRELAAAILLEGRFTSPYAGRRPAEVTELINSAGLTFHAKTAKPGKMVITSDADLFGNDVSEQQGPLEMGMFVFEPGHVYDNGTFFLNCMEYMTDEKNLLEARGKSFDARVLDPKVVEAERSRWQLINIAVPVAAMLLLGSIFFFIRKRKYA
jgi:ABC-2 type transport system permease protein